MKARIQALDPEDVQFHNKAYAIRYNITISVVGALRRHIRRGDLSAHDRNRFKLNPANKM